MTSSIRILRSLAAAAALCLASGVALAQERFPTPDAAAKALVDAAKHGEQGAMTRIFGPEGRPLLTSGDPEEDKRRLAAFNDAAAESVTLAPRGDNARILTLGKRNWEFPIPIARQGDAWAFDLKAGKAEIQNRTVGMNELSAIEACHTYVAAQKEYYRLDRDGDEVQEYAARILSTPGKRDGLYWDAVRQSDRSPLDGKIADSVIEAARGGKPVPYHGYYFKILTGQGPDAPGGAYSYRINGRLLVGFGLVAWPAEWRKTGVMTFVCNQQGKVYQTDLGPDTARKASRMTRYNPGRDWVLAE
jgi:hypothetical protein